MSFFDDLESSSCVCEWESEWVCHLHYIHGNLPQFLLATPACHYQASTRRAASKQAREKRNGKTVFYGALLDYQISLRSTKWKANSQRRTSIFHYTLMLACCVMQWGQIMLFRLKTKTTLECSNFRSFNQLCRALAKFYLAFFTPQAGRESEREGEIMNEWQASNL